MSALRRISRGYGFFISKSLEFSVSPYTEVFKSVALDDQERYSNDRAIAAAIVCAVFTFVVPVLPVLTTITATIAAVAITLALFSMLVTLPLALLADICLPSEEYSRSPIGYRMNSF